MWLADHWTENIDALQMSTGLAFIIATKATGTFIHGMRPICGGFLRECKSQFFAVDKQRVLLV